MSHDYVMRPSGEEPAGGSIDYRAELNDQQYAAVTAPPGPSLVIAGAGSGKTRTLTYRVAYLLEQGIAADRILLLTFTNKAAREMMRRVGDLLGKEPSSLWGGTFHSIGNRILRQQAQIIGYAKDFTILDREDSRHLLAACLHETGADEKGAGFPKADVLGEIFSLAANTLEPVADLVARSYDHFVGLAGRIEEIRRAYQERKRRSNAMDFDDLLALWLELLRTKPEILEYYQRRFQFILVDEYQDTNRLQSAIIDLLAARHHNLMVVGDDAQSIYSWRGADFANILRFGDRHAGARIYKIETNYRSTPEILSAANAAIAANREQYPKVLAAARESGDKPAVVACLDPFQQAAFVAQRVRDLHEEEGESLGQIAVLYRSHFHALELQLELTKQGIPFSITSGIRFFEQAHIKDVTAYLKLIANPRDEVAFQRIAQLLPGIGEKGAAKLWGQLAPLPLPSDPVLDVVESGPAQARRLQSLAARVPKKTAAAWAQLTATIAQLEAADLQAKPAGMIRLVLDAGYDDYLRENYDNHRTRLEDLQQLGAFATQFNTLEEFLTQLALLTNVESEGQQPRRDEGDQLRLSTIHQAKGLEFNVVFVIMLCDGLFPSLRSLEVPAGEEEERRLFYVAVTRARNQLYLSHPLVRRGFDGATTPHLASRFLGEIPPDLLETWNLRDYHSYE